MKKATLGIEKTCQKCLKRRETTHSRDVYMKNYVGPCGDSFCYAGCDSSSCKAQRMTICDACHKLLARPEKGRSR